jgi:hypothetical protein
MRGLVDLSRASGMSTLDVRLDASLDARLGVMLEVRLDINFKLTCQT